MDRAPQDTRTSSLRDFEVLFRRNHRFLCMIALSYVKDPAVAEDLVQEFFVNYWQRRDLVKLQQSFEAYACRSVKNIAISWLRKEESAGRRLAGFIQPEYNDPEAEAALANERDALELRVMQMIDELPPERKKIFLLSTQGGQTYKQIAEQLGISVNTVKSQIVKAYATLRQKAGPLVYAFILFVLYSDTYK